MKELYLLLEEEELAPQQQADNKMCTGDAWTTNTVSGVPNEPWGRAGSAATATAWQGVVASLGVHHREEMLLAGTSPQEWSPALVAPLSLTPGLASLRG